MVAGMEFFEKKNRYSSSYTDNGGIVYKELKGGKKVKPYLEVKVVKVKKKKEYCNHIMIDGEKYTFNGEYLHKENSNWVNGENLDKIKFPCFCRFTFPKGHKHIGVINKIGGIRDQYILTDIDKQYYQTGCFLWMQHKLKDLVEYFDIHILKGKIIIFEEE